MGISGGFGVLEPQIHHLSFSGPKWPFQAPKALRFKGKMANFEAKTTFKQEKKNAKRTNGTHFTRVQRGGGTGGLVKMGLFVIICPFGVFLLQFYSHCSI